MVNLLLTGATGFVGKRFLEYKTEMFNILPVSFTKWDEANIEIFNNVETVVHLAGIAHRMEKTDPDLYFEVNFRKTKVFADIAKSKGIKHFIFISTIKVYGEHAELKCFNDLSICNPTDSYGKSKLMAEEYLKSIEDHNFIVSIIRPPLVYGYQVKGNLHSLLKLVYDYPIVPFGNINNYRSIVYVGNLMALISVIIESKKGGVFLAGDSEPYSTTKLVDTIINKANLSTKNFALPSILRNAIRLFKPEIYNRIFEDLIIDNTNTNKNLNFKPPYSFEEGINEIVKK